MRKPDLILFTCLCSVALGWWLVTIIWNGTVYVYVGETRSPAAVKNITDYYPIDGRMLRESMDQQMFENVSFVSRENEIGIRLGHFLVRDRHGKRQFACQVQSRPGVYDRMELSFLGVGVSDNGKIPKMTVDSLCEAEDEISFINPVWLALSDIYQSEPKAQELKIPELGGAAIKFDDLASQWPDKWTLIRVRLYRSDAGAPSLMLEPKSVSHQALTFNWK